MRKRVLSLVAILILSIAGSSAIAQSLQISTGLEWLNSDQTTTGNWPGVETNEYYSTVAALDTVYLLEPTSSTYTTAFVWLSGQIASPTDYLARRIIALKRAGLDTSAEVEGLLLYRDSIGGWGINPGFDDGILDSALALQALYASNYSDTTLIGQSLNYLANHQNPDGGWGFIDQGGNQVSSTYYTAIVLNTFSLYKSTFIFQTPITNAVNYLLSKQNSDGGFGSSPSTVYDTALTFEALVASGANMLSVASSAINYLTTTQLADGSWDDDPYSTALAVRALASARPNLVIASSDISLSKPMPQANESVTFTATVHNVGFDSASNIIVRFYLGDPAVGGTQIGTDQIIPFIALGSSVQASIAASFTGTGGKTIFVVADPGNLISETSKADNKASARIWVATGPDLAVYSEELIPSTYVPVSGTAFTLIYTVRNLGESSTSAFDVALYDGSPTGTPLQTAHISGLNGSEVRTGTLGVTLTTNGNHTLYLVADSGNQITELSKTNNTGSVTVNVGGTQTLTDLAVTSQDITLTPSRPHAGDTVTISANVRNIGAEAVNNFTVEIFNGQPEAGGVLLAVQTISLVAGGSQAVSANWPIPAGIHDIVVVLDRTNQIAETNEINNRASVRVMTDMVDISLSATDLVFNPAHPVSGDSVALTITAHNTGIKQTGAFNLALYDGDPAAGGALLQTYPVTNITSDGLATLSYIFTAPTQTQTRIYRFYAVADTENVVAELYEDNNTAIRSLTIKGSTDVLGPDLVPTKIDLTDTTTDSQTLAISGNAHVTFQNKGDDKITTSFNVIIFEDKDGDGKYTAGVDNVLSTATNTMTLWPEGANTIDLPLSGTVTFLHSPLYAFVDSGDVILEQNKDNNIVASCKDCQVVPTNPIQPVVKWSWSGALVVHPPVVTHLIDSNGDGRIDANDVPVVVFVAVESNMFYGKIVALRGDTGATLFTYSDPNHPISRDSYLAVGDIDSDGVSEIVVTRQGDYGYPGIIVLDHNGQLKWDNWQAVAAYNTTILPWTVYINENVVPVIADIDGDGKPEIIVADTVINPDGTIKWWPGGPNGRKYGSGAGAFVNYFISSIAVDLDMDGKQEVLAGNTAYNADGTVKWWNRSLSDGIAVVGKFDNGPYPEIVLVTRYPELNVYMLEHDGTIKWGPISMLDLNRGDQSNGLGAPVVIADFDGDGKMEIGLKGFQKYFILDKNGYVKKTITIPYDYSSPSGYDWTGAPTVFDLNGAGKPSILMSGGSHFRIYDGKTGTSLYDDKNGGGSGWTGAYQNVIMADVDGDGHVEAIVNNSSGLRVYGSKNNDWVGARTGWNEGPYHVTNVNDDGTIPQYEAPSWLLNNTYMCQASIGRNPNPYLTPNLTASYMRAEQVGAAINLAVRVGNGGAIASGPTVTVTFYDGDPASGGTVIGTASTTRALNPGDYQDVIYSWAGGSLGLYHLYAVVDAANAITECRKDDNQASADFTIQTSYADLKIGPEDISIPVGPYYEGIPLQITANVNNIGTLAASNIAVRMYYGNPSSGGTQIGNDQVIPSINAASFVPLVFTYDTTGRSGTNVLYIVVDPANTIIESSKSNNAAAVTLTVQPPTLPDLAISPSDIQVSPTTLHEGDTASITATIHNLGVSAGNIPIYYYLGNPNTGGTLVSTQIIYPMLTLGSVTTVQASLDTTGHAGQQQIYVVIDPGNAITESRKDNNSAFQPFFVQTAGLNASVTLDKTVYQADELVTATITAADTTGSARSLTLGLFVQDSAGNRIATISSTNPVTINPNSVATLSRTWNTGTTLSGQYTIIAELAESGQVISRKSAGFTILPDTRVSAQVTTDKITYNPNETAALTAVATSQSRNFIFEKITAVLTVGSSQSAVYADTKTITTLMPGATFTFKDYWNTGTFAPGTYPVTLTLRDSTNAVIATGTQNLTISSIVKPTAVLRGRISISSQELLTGDTTTVSYTVTNVGNVDLQNFTLSVLTVNVSDQTVYNIFAYPTILAMGGSVSNTLPITTADYTAKDYLVVLRANIAGTEETLAGTYFRIEGAPSAPSLASPAINADVETFTPTLSANNASDPNDDKLTYEFELYNDSGLTQLVASSGLVPEGTGITSWAIPVSLIENQTYFWRSRAYDNWLYGDWMSPASFRVNTVNDPPTAPTIASPVDGTSVATFTPVLMINNATDPDSPSLTYNFDVALDPGFTQMIETKKGVFPAADITYWQLPLSLTENSWYYWRAQADDWLITGPWSATTKFFVNTTNEAPTTPIIITPINNATVPSLSTDITITNSTDFDSPVITYFFELDTTATFDSPNIIHSGGVAQGQGTTTWHVTGLQEDTQYYVRAKASDGRADSAWSNPVGFFVNTVNEPPTTPTLANPSNGAGVTVLTPTLSVHNATDPDRDALNYDFEVYSDAALTSLVTSTMGVVETAQITSLTIPASLTENQTYYWRARAFDGTLASGWMPAASFMVNTANDAPGAPTLSSPLDGSSVETLNPTLSVTNAIDPDSTNLTYSFELYSGTTLVTSVINVPAGSAGITSITLTTTLQDNTVYQWRARAYDGDRYGPWMAMATFTTHLQQTGIGATIDFDPNTLNKTSNGTWVVVYIELPAGYNVADIVLSSIRLEGTIPAETWPYAVGDHDKDGIPDLMVKFKRSDVINLLPNGEQVTVHVSGRVGTTTFEGVDIIRVMK